MNNTITYSIAKKYLDKGMSIFPVILSKDEKGKIQKRPAVAWKQFITRLPTEDELHEWFDSPRFNGIGMATGKVSGLNVLDVEGYATEEVINKFTSPLVTKTISDGYHFFYKWTHEIHNSVKIEGEAVDFRGDGGFVVLPPSSMDGKSYRWNVTTTDFEALQPLPTPIELSLLGEKKIQQTNLKADSSGIFPQALPGERNMVATKVAGSMIAQIPRKLWEVNGWGGFVEWNNKNPDPLDEQELRTTWLSITSTESKKRGLDEDNFTIYEGTDAIDEYKRMQEEFGEGLTTWYAEVDEYLKFLPEQLYLISAPTHVGKTTFSLNMAARIASYGFQALFVSLEQGVFIAPRVIGMIGSFPKDLSIMTSSKMVTAEGITEKVKSLEKKPKVIFIDHLHFMKKTGNNVTQGIDEMMAELQNMAKELKLPVVVISHLRKLNDNRKPTMDDLRDSSSLQQIPSVVVLLHREILPESMMNEEGSYLDPYTDMIIPKNRIQGKAGGLTYVLEKSGAIRFVDREVKKNREREIQKAKDNAQNSIGSDSKTDYTKTYSQKKATYNQSSYLDR